MSGRACFRKGIIFLFAVCATAAAQAQEMVDVRGCTDSRAKNFRADATVNDGTCLYARTKISPYFSVDLPPAVSGSSGLVFFEHCLYTHNDHRDRTLYQLDTNDAHILFSIYLPDMAHRDVEDVTSDSLYLYLGDFGNNASGNRSDLQILRLLKSSLNDTHPVMDTILFTYPDQRNLLPSAANRTNFDCEAMIAAGDSLYLFSKQWGRQGSTLYALPKYPGHYVADSLDTYAVEGLITSAAYHEAKNQVVLCGYTSLLQPFLLLLYDYPAMRFFSGNKRKILLNLPLHQIEAVEHIANDIYFLSNETFRFSGSSISAQLHKIDLSPFLSASGK